MIKPDVYAKLNKADISAKKIGPVLDMVRGLSVERAKITLAFENSKAGKLVLKLLKSAESNAKVNKKLDTKNMYVSQAYAGPAGMVKWGRIVGHYHFNPILKRTANIFIGLSERNSK